MATNQSEKTLIPIATILFAGLSLVGCQQTISPPTDGGIAPVLSIISPTAGTVVTTHSLNAAITVQHSVPLTALKYQFANGSEVSLLGSGAIGTNAVLNTITRNFMVTVPESLANGASVLKVTATDSKGRSNSTEVAVTINRADSVAITPGPQLTLDTEGRVVLGQSNGVRVLTQQVGGVSREYTYARGVIQITAEPRLRTTGQSVSRVEFWVAETPSSPAIDYIGDDTAAPYQATFDTARALSQEGSLLYLVARVTRNNGSSYTEYTPIVIDNQGPQSPDPSVSGATGAANSNFLTGVCADSDSGKPDNNWARGVVRHRLSNTELVDEPSILPNLNPSGIESVTYYYLSTSKELSVPKPNNPARPSYIRSNATASARVQFAGSTNDYRIDVNSVNNLPDGSYILFAVMNDQLGNETASNFSFRLSIDNTAPVPFGSIHDQSSLPFLATEGYVSDYFSYTATAVDAGVGFPHPEVQPAGSSVFGNAETPMVPVENGCGPTANGRVIYGAPVVTDSNYFADGPSNLAIRARDILGNTLADTVVDTAIVDNTDPEIDIINPMPGQTFAAGDLVNMQTTSADATSGILTIKLFWNDFVPDWQGISGTGFNNTQRLPAAGRKTPDAGNEDLWPYTERLRLGNGGPGFIASPVQFAEGDQGYWTALYPRGFALPLDWTNSNGEPKVINSPTEPMRLHAWAIDKAGNVRMLSRRINVTESGSLDEDGNLLPLMGNFDVYKVGSQTNYQPVTAGGYARDGATEGKVIGANLTSVTSDEATDFHNVDLSTLSSDAGRRIVPITRAALYRWNGGSPSGYLQTNDSFLGWMMLDDPSLDSDPNLFDRRIYIEGWAEIDQDAGLLLGNCDADGCLEMVNVAPWFLYADTFSSSAVNRSQDNLLTEQAYWGMSALGYLAYGTRNSVDTRSIGEYNLAYEELKPYTHVTKLDSDTAEYVLNSSNATFRGRWHVQIYNRSPRISLGMTQISRSGPISSFLGQFYTVCDINFPDDFYDICLEVYGSNPNVYFAGEEFEDFQDTTEWYDMAGTVVGTYGFGANDVLNHTSGIGLILSGAFKAQTLYPFAVKPPR